MVYFDNSIVGIILLVAGIMLKTWPPDSINTTYGYRTPFSRKNQNTWDEGNRFCAIMMIIAGILSLIVAITVTVMYDKGISIFIQREVAGKVSMIFSLAVMFLGIFATEFHLKRMFDKNGEIKNKDN